MNITLKGKTILKSALLATSIFVAFDANAWVVYGGRYYHGGYYRDAYPGYYGRYYRPAGYYGPWGGGYYRVYPRCTYMQQCYPNGVCVNKRICR